MTATAALYGSPPAALVASPAAAMQLSPLVPGASAIESCADESLGSLVMLAPAGTIERRYTIAHSLRALHVGAPFTILAPRDKGGARLGKELASFGCSGTDDSKQHHRIVTGTRPEKLSDIDDAIAEGAPRLIESLGLWSQPGVFSWDRIDAGSALLAKHLPQLLGKGADFGCGIGYLSRTVLASPTVSHLTMVDIDRRAVEQARKNVDLARVEILWQDLQTTTTRSVDFVVMNPPFHDGGIEDRALGQRFIERAAAALRPGGTCWLVANRHLPYEAVMQPLFSRVTLHAQADGFKIYEAVK